MKQALVLLAIILGCAACTMQSGPRDETSEKKTAVTDPVKPMAEVTNTVKMLASFPSILTNVVTEVQPPAVSPLLKTDSRIDDAATNAVQKIAAVTNAVGKAASMATNAPAAAQALATAASILKAGPPTGAPATNAPAAAQALATAVSPILKTGPSAGATATNAPAAAQALATAASILKAGPSAGAPATNAPAAAQALATAASILKAGPSAGATATNAPAAAQALATAASILKAGPSAGATATNAPAAAQALATAASILKAGPSAGPTATNAPATAQALATATSILKAGPSAGAPATNALPKIKLLSAKDFPIRDPFVLADEKTGLYYLYATQTASVSNEFGVMVYTSKNLKEWTPPFSVLSLTNHDVTSVWAPEVHQYNGHYFLFATLTFKQRVSLMATLPQGTKWPFLFKRGTWIFTSVTPIGPFTPVKNESLTPPEWMALDGTLLVDDSGKPYLVFCHEWVQVIDGAICVQELTHDLHRAMGNPQEILSASSAVGAVKGEKEGKVTDGPFFYKSKLNSSLYMIWSTFLENESGYCEMMTRSATGSVLGPWTPSIPIYAHDGGHAMIFKAFNGKTLAALHQPNSKTKERLHLYEVFDDGNSLHFLPFTSEP